MTTDDPDREMRLERIAGRRMLQLIRSDDKSFTGSRRYFLAETWGDRQKTVVGGSVGATLDEIEAYLKANPP
jgi:hypothetical protein